MSMRTHDELVEQTTALEEIAGGPLLTVRWQMQQAHEMRRIREEVLRFREVFEKRQDVELRRIREALERLAPFAPDASGGDFDAKVQAAAEAYAGDHVIQRG